MLATPTIQRILVIDDDADTRELMRLVLERAGYRVAIAEDGEAGLQAQRTEPADLVLTDIFMPNQDGPETIHQLRSEYPAVKVLVISGGAAGLNSSNYLFTAREIGAHAMLSKPIEHEALLSAVRALLS